MTAAVVCLNEDRRVRTPSRSPSVNTFSPFMSPAMSPVMQGETAPDDVIAASRLVDDMACEPVHIEVHAPTTPPPQAPGCGADS